MRTVIARIFDYSSDGIIAAEDTPFFGFCRELPDDAAQEEHNRALYADAGLEALYASKLARAVDADGLIRRDRDPADTRAIRLALADRGREVVRPAITEVSKLLDHLMAPLGGVRDPRAKALVADLVTLLDTPLDP